MNIARGSLIDTEALVQALDERASSAARRSTSPTPSRCPTTTRCGTTPRALITPHVANPPNTMARDLAKRVQENVRRYADGEELLAPVSPEQGY